MLTLSIVFYFLAFVSSLLSHFFNTLKKLTRFVIFLGLLLYMLHITMLSIKVRSFPFADAHGFYSLLGNLMLGVLVLVSFKYDYLWKFSAFFAILGILSTLLAMPAEPSPYRSPLYSLHITSALASYAFAFLGGLSSILKLFLESRLKHKSITGFFMPLSLLRGVERLSMNLSFLFFTLTLIFGSFWSRSFFGKHWVSDPKLIFVLYLWTYYAVVVHLNLLKRIKPKTLSYAIILGMFFTLLNILFVRHEL
ncbi:MAG: cytochrome C biogenesis protein [Aquificota bacterium]|nr:MAG: cytochrome C biogenesis protein [Aquificota bacterium]